MTSSSASRTRRLKLGSWNAGVLVVDQCAPAGVAACALRSVDKRSSSSVLVPHRVESRDQEDVGVAKRGAQLIAEQQRLVRRVVDVDQPVRERRCRVDVADADPRCPGRTARSDADRAVSSRRAADVVAGRRQQAAHVVVDADQVQRGRHAEPAHRERRPYGRCHPGLCASGTARRMRCRASEEATKCSPPAPCLM